MAAVEVLAFAASEICGWPRSHRLTKKTGHRLPQRDRTGLREKNQDVIARLDARLVLIANAWVKLRTSQHARRDSYQHKAPITTDFCSPKYARRLPRHVEPEPSSSDLLDPSSTDTTAQRHCPDFHQCGAPAATGSKSERTNARKGELFSDPNMDLIDFDSDEGFVRAAGKKKKKATAFNWADVPDENKDDGAEDGADGNKDQNTGNAGGSSSAGGDGGDGGDDKKGEDQQGDGEAGVDDDIWGFASAGKKKKKKASDAAPAADSFGLPDIPTTDFHEIKLDDAGGGQEGDSLDLGLFPKTEKITSGITAWTSSWAPGSWSWGGLKSPGGSDMPKPAEEEKPTSPEAAAQTNPWSAKPKKKETSSFSFGSFDEGEDTKGESFDFMSAGKPKKQEESFDFMGSSKKDANSGFSWGAASTKPADDFWSKVGDKKVVEEEKPADVEASDDIWGFSSSKKDKKKKNRISFVEEVSKSEEPLPEAPDPPPAIDSAMDSALVAEEEAELRKLQTKKDIGSKLTKKQQERLKVLTENAKAREEAASSAAATQAAEPAVDADEFLDPPPSDQATPVADDGFSQADADEKALIIQEEEDEIYLLKSKKKLKKAEKDRLRILEERAEDRAREAEEASVSKDAAVPEVVDLSEALVEDPPADIVDDAQAEADEKARIIREEEDELADLRAKKKPKKTDKDRIRILEERANDRAREAEEAAAAADTTVQESSGDATESKTNDTAPTSIDDNFGDFEKDEAAHIVEEEELELEMLLSKSKLKKTEKARLKELQDNKDRREQEVAEKDETQVLDADESAPVEDAPSGGDATEDPPKEDDPEARIAEEEEMEMELLLSKPKLKKNEKARLKVLQGNKEQREWEAAQKAEATVEEPPQPDPAPEAEAKAEVADEVALQKEINDAQIAAEESELSDLLAKFKPKKAEKARIKELQDRKDQREWEAAEKELGETPPTAEPIVEDAPAAPDPDPADEAALQKEKDDALIAAEESELFDLISKSKLKKSEKGRLMDLQDRKDARDAEARLAAEKVDQEARELEEQQKREAEEKLAADLAAEVAAEEAEISSLESKKKLKKSEKERLADLKLRRDERASAEAAKLADELMKEDADNDAGQKFSWADDDPAQDNGAGDDWMDWGGLTSSGKSKKKAEDEPVPDPPAANRVDDSWSAWGAGKKDKKSKTSDLIDFGGAAKTPAVPDPPSAAATQPSGFDFGWGKPTPKEEPIDEIWGFGSSSKKKSKNAPVEVVEDTIIADPMSATKDKGEDDFWSTFGTKKSKDKKSDSSKDDLVAKSPLPVPSPIVVDLTAAEEGDDAGNAWGDLSGSTELSKSKSTDKKSSSSSKEPKLSKKELEKMEKDKKKAEKEQKAREEQEAQDAAELARLEEEERLEAEAKAEQDRLAQEEADRIRKEEEDKQAALDAIAKEESDLAVLQAKKDSGKKLLKKEKEKYDKLFANCQARADEKAAQEAAEQAARDEADRLQREAEEQALKEAIDKEESELKDLQKKKDAGRKLLKKDKERYEVLHANKKARRQAEKDAEAALAGEAVQDEFVDPLEKDLAQLDGNELDELDAFLSAPPKATPIKKATDVDPFSFWGASKKPTSSSKKDKSLVTESVSQIPDPTFLAPTCHFHNTNYSVGVGSILFGCCAEIAHAESSSSYKLLEATTRVTRGGTRDKDTYDVVPAGAWSSAWVDPISPATHPAVVLQLDRDVQYDQSPAAAEPMKTKSAAGKSKIADRLKAFEAVPPPPPAPADPLPPPPPPAPVEEVQSKASSKKVDIPGSFPDEFDEGNPDDIIEVIEMPIRPKKSSKKSSKAKASDAPVPIPPPPPAVPDAPIPPPPEVKKESKKERPKINRDGGSSWGTWTASTTREKEKKSSSKSKSADEPKKGRKEERSPEKEEKLSSKGSSSDKAERKDKDMDVPRSKLKSVFASTPPISRSTSTRDKRHKEGRSSRRPSVDDNSGMVSPPPEDMPEPGSKAAKILGIGMGMGLGRSLSKRKNSMKAVDDDDIVMVGGTDADSPVKPSRRRTSKSYHRDDDIVMVDAADATPTPPPGLKRSNTTGSAKKSFGGLFGGMLNRPEPKRRATYHTDGEDAAAATDAEAEARKAARRARRVEREVAEKSKDEMRRDKRRKQEEEAEAQRQADKEARRAERRAARDREAGDHKAEESKEERHRRKRAERDAAETDAEAEARRARRERRKARAGESERENDEDRRQRRAEKRSAREAEGKVPTRRRTEPVEDDFVYPRPTKMSRRHTDGLATAAAKAAEAPAWPHSGTSSWVKDHSDAGPPPDDGGMTTEAPEDGEGDEDAARRERRRRRRYGDADGDGAGEKRRKRGEERSEGSDERRRERKAAVFADGRGSGGFGGLWKKLTRN